MAIAAAAELKNIEHILADSQPENFVCYIGNLIPLVKALNKKIRRYAGFFYHVNCIHGVLCQWIIWRWGYIGAPKFNAIYMRYINENKNPRSAGGILLWAKRQLF